jgi:tetratricopeptide (TPR) repeat protein
VLFDAGKVVHASVASNPTSIERILRAAGRLTDEELAQANDVTDDLMVTLGDRLVMAKVITQRELERQLRQAIENVVFELMSWREGFFSFEERQVNDVKVDARIRISTESLLMEGARRIDEWSRIADKVPSLSVIPSLSPVEDDRASVLDLLPNEWEVLMMIDGDRDLRDIAGALGAGEFDVAKIAYGLVSTGVVQLRGADRLSQRLEAIPESAGLARAKQAFQSGKYEAAVSEARAVVEEESMATEARLLVAKALGKLSRRPEAVDELRRAVQADPLTAEVHLELGFAAVHVGDFANARASWEHFLRLAPTSSEVGRVRAALETLTQLQHLLEANGDL